MKSCKLYIVRHGESTDNVADLRSGHKDPELTDKGREQVAMTKEKLSNIVFDEVYSSDLKRAVETALILFGEPVPQEHQLPGLRERDFGIFDGLPNSVMRDAESKHADFDSISDHDYWHLTPHESVESSFELAERFIGALVSIAEANPGKTVLVAAHGGTLRTTLIRLGYANPRELPPKSIDNAAYVELDYQNGEFTTGIVVGANKQTLEV